MSNCYNLVELLGVIKYEASIAKGMRIKLLVSLFRLSTYYCCRRGPVNMLFFPFFVFYKIYSEFIVGLELPPSVRIGRGLQIYHGYGMVVHKNVVIGENCTLRQGVTIGNNGRSQDQVPAIGNNVDFGAGSIAIGKICIGDGVVLGAGVVVTKDVPPNHVIVGPSPRCYAKKLAVL